MSVKLHIRPTPNHEFIHHWPGIPSGSSDVKAAHVQGSIEVVPVKLKGAKAISLTLHLKKLETVASKGQAVNRYKEILNSQVLWRATSGKRKVLADDANAVVQLLQQKEFHFEFPLPEGLPPSVTLSRESNQGISYELAATLKHVSSSSSCFSSSRVIETSSVASIILDKYELLPNWPVYEYRALRENNTHLDQGIYMTASRPTSAYGPGDTLRATVEIRSTRSDPVKLAHIDLFLCEVITIDPQDSARSAPTVNNVVHSRATANVVLTDLGRTFDLQGSIPKTHPRVSISSGKHVSISYHLRITAAVSRMTPGPTIAPIDIDKLPVAIGNWTIQEASALKEKILDYCVGVPYFLDAPLSPDPTPEPSLHPQESFQRFTPNSIPYSAAQNQAPDGLSAFTNRNVSASSTPTEESSVKRLSIGPNRQSSLLVADAKRRISENKRVSVISAHTFGRPEPKDDEPVPPMPPQADQEKALLYAAAQAEVAERRDLNEAGLPEEYMDAAKEKQRAAREANERDQGPGSFLNMSQNSTVENDIHAVEAENSAVSAYALAVREREMRSGSSSTPGIPGNYAPVSTPTSSAADTEKARLAREYRPSLPSIPGRALPEPGVSRSVSNISAHTFNTEREAYEAAVAARDARRIVSDSGHSRHTSVDTVPEEERTFGPAQQKMLAEEVAPPVPYQQPSEVKQSEYASLGVRQPPSASNRYLPASFQQHTSNTPYRDQEQSNSPARQSRVSVAASDGSASLYRDPSISIGKRRALDPSESNDIQ